MDTIISAITTQQSPQINFWEIAKYLITPSFILGGMWFLLARVYNLGELNEKFKGALEDIKSLKKDSKRLISHVDIIKGYLSSTSGTVAQLFANGSPLVLQPKGLKLLNESGFDQIYQKDKLWFVDQIKNFKVKTLADIDEATVKLMDQIRDDPRFNNFKDVAFQNGVPVDLLFRVCALYLRDQVAREILGNNKR